MPIHEEAQLFGIGWGGQPQLLTAAAATQLGRLAAGKRSHDAWERTVRAYRGLGRAVPAGVRAGLPTAEVLGGEEARLLARVTMADRQGARSLASLRVDMGQAERLIARVDTLAQGPLGTQAVEGSIVSGTRVTCVSPASSSFGDVLVVVP